MTFDGITTRAVVASLRETILGGHIKKINQIGAKQITLQFYANKTHHLLYLSADSNNARFNLTEAKYENPLTPPSFCMILRKHLGQSRLIDIEQFGLDRTVAFRFSGRNELGDDVIKTLIVEIMGKHSNLILLEGTRIIEAIQRVSHDMSRIRQIYPGKAYVRFTSDKRDPLTDNIGMTALMQGASPDLRIRKLFFHEITGFSPMISDELCFRAQVNPDLFIRDLTVKDVERLDCALADLLSAIRSNDYAPARYALDKPRFYVLPLLQYATVPHTTGDINSIIDRYYQAEHRDDRIGAKQHVMLEKLSDRIDHKQRLLARYEQEFEETLDRESIKEEGDLLAASVHHLRKGASEITLPDFYHDMAMRTILLNPRRTPWENIEYKYRRYSKLKTANRMLAESIPKIKAELAYLYQLGHMLKGADDLQTLSEICEEFEREGLLTARGKRIKVREEKALAPMRFETTGGFEILVGRSNLQNDRLTLKLADRNDYFFHSRIIPGAHVILRTAGRTPGQADIEAAAWLAARYSSHAKESYVDIDYTQRKNVYKAKGAKPGMVYYNDYATIRAALSAEPALISAEPKLE